MSAIDIIILAAGASRRMGTSKQLLDIAGQPLLHRTVQMVRTAGISRKILVVLGHQAAMHLDVLSAEPVQIVINPAWESGMGSSIRYGLEQLDGSNPPDRVMLLVCDQPMLSVEVLQQLAAASTLHDVVVSEYSTGSIGTPVVVASHLIPRIREIPEHTGLRHFFPMWDKQMIRIPFPGGEIDLDTPEDYQNFLKGLH